MFTTPYFFYVWIPLTPLHMLLGGYTYLLIANQPYCCLQWKKKAQGERYRVHTAWVPHVFPCLSILGLAWTLLIAEMINDSSRALPLIHVLYARGRK